MLVTVCFPDGKHPGQINAREIFRLRDVDAGLVRKVASSLAAPFLAEGVTHTEDVGASAPRGVLPEENRTPVARVGGAWVPQ